MSSFNEDMNNREQDWYSRFYNEITNEILTISDIEKFKENKINIITFNYDRSLENFLEKSLFYSFSEVRDKLAIFLSVIKIVHVYGKICNLQWEDIDYGIKYSSNRLLELAINLKDNIQIIYEERKNKLQIQDMFKSATKVLFLGFGYSKENLNALGINNIFNHKQFIYGSAYKFTNTERKRVVDNIRRLNPALPDNQIFIEDIDCAGLWRECF